MRTIGKAIKEFRAKKRYSVTKLSKETRIKESFIRAIENEKWSDLPDYPVVSGFVRKIAGSLGVAEEQALGLLRRDYPPIKIPINPKPDVSDKFTWSPRKTFVAGATLVILMVIGYLVFQYSRFTGEPKLIVDAPQQEQVVNTGFLKVTGKTDSDAIIRVNNQTAIVNADGFFDTEIEVFEGTQSVKIVATSRAGKESIIERKISVN